MEKQWFVASTPRTPRTVYTIVGSVVLHGSVIAAAALWPVRSAPSAPPPLVTIFQPAPEVDTIPLPPSPSPDIDAATPDAADEPPSPLANRIDTAPPPSEEPAMTNPAPRRPPSKTVVGKTRSTAMTAAVGTPGQPGKPGLPGSKVGRWHTPQPPYPYAMRAARVQGSGSVRITTDGSGRVVNVGVVQSTGNALLDANTGQFARANWSGPPNASVTVPITYQIR